MNLSELREKSVNDLKLEVENLLKAQFSARLQLATQQNSNTSQLSKIRKDIARVKTLISEKMRNI